ncbi:unnamed protein product [Soboliphyme baturini]|uniref:HEAT repeat-containing protein 1 n=1 Tax=Soboliphyme baturini TaxID=241478 RepID=A0A183IV90_9BILA|nr:unnamed protein product [Soboliphyme baturini]
METSLSKQLKRLALPQSSLYKHNRKRVSLLFDSSTAATQDRETIFALGVTGFDELVNIESSFAEFKESLFSDAAMVVERAMLTKERNADLDKTIKRFIMMSIPYFPLRSFHKALEWLIYRFHIHQYNVDIMLRCIISYYDMNIFLRMLQILQIKNTDPAWYWLLPYQKSNAPLDRAELLKQCKNNANFLSIVTELIPECFEAIEQKQHRSLQVVFSFCTSILCGYLDACDDISDAMVAKIMAFVVRGLRSGNTDFAMCSLMVTSELAIKYSLLPTTCEILTDKILTNLTEELAFTALSTVIVLFQTQSFDRIPAKVFKKIVRHDHQSIIIEQVEKLSDMTNVESFVSVFLSNLFENAVDEATAKSFDASRCEFLKECLLEWRLDPDLSEMVFKIMLQKFDLAANNEESKAAFQHIFHSTLSRLAKRYPVTYDMLIVKSAKKHIVSDEVLQEFTAMCGVAGFQEGGSQSDLLLSLCHPTGKVRHLALKKIFGLFRTGYSQVQILNVCCL